jgi:diacylglycerol kinase (ATP)
MGEKAPPILVVSMGTANLLGRHLGLLWKDHRHLAQRISKLVRDRHTALLDVAAANGDLFLLMAGVGMDAMIVHELDRMRTGPIDYASYAIPAALALGTYAYPPITVRIDGRVVFDDRPGMAFVGNVKEYGTGFPLLPHARADDGLLDVLVLECASRADAVRQLLFAAAGEHLRTEGTVYAKGKRVRIDSPTEIPVQVDGEPAGHTPVDIDLLPVRLPFIVPA